MPALVHCHASDPIVPVRTRFAVRTRLSAQRPGLPLCAELRVLRTASHDPHGCNHEAESRRLRSAGETATLPLEQTPGRRPSHRLVGQAAVVRNRAVSASGLSPAGQPRSRFRSGGPARSSSSVPIGPGEDVHASSFVKGEVSCGAGCRFSRRSLLGEGASRRHSRRGLDRASASPESARPDLVATEVRASLPVDASLPLIGEVRSAGSRRESRRVSCCMRKGTPRSCCCPFWSRAPRGIREQVPASRA
jgi:hypothetical protein